MGIKILLADDSVTAQNMGKKILSEAGHEVVTVSNGAAAAKKIAEIKPELVLLDVFMPGYTGLELCEKLRNAAETSKIPVLLTVGRMEPYNAQDGARVKADGVIVKPFEATDLTAAVERIAEKVKTVAKPAESAAPKMQVVYQGDAPLELDGRKDNESAVRANKSDDDSKPYDKTTRLDSKQIHAALNGIPEGGEAAQANNSGALNSDSYPGNPQRDSVSPAIPVSTFEETIGDKTEVGSGENRTEIKSDAAPVPSFMMQYLPQEEAEAPSASDSGAEKHSPDPVEAASIHDRPTGAFPLHSEFMLAQSQNEIHGDRRQRRELAAAIPEIEPTSVAPAPDVPVANEPGLELTRQAAPPEIEISADPALETDPHRSTMDFPTQFGTQQPDLANQLLETLQHPAGGNPNTVDEFEARLNAAMEAFGDSSAAPETDLTSANSHLSELGSRFGTDPAPVADSFEAQVEAAMHDFEISEAGAEQTYPATSEPKSEAIEQADAVSQSNEFEIAPVDGPESVFEIDGDEAAANRVPSSEGVFSADAIGITTPETDDSVIQQMREGLSHLPVEQPHFETAEPAPMAMAAAASAVSSPQTGSLPHESEAEIGRAMAAAMGGEAAAAPLEEPSASVEASGDNNHLAGAVESVMKRELPNLIGKIMAELDLRKRR